MLICSTFSLAMFSDLELGERLIFSVSEQTLDGVFKILCGTQWRSVVGHADTAKLFSDSLGVDVIFNRETVALARDTMGDYEVLLVGQYIGPRLAEGVSKLPEGAEIKWLFVRAYVEQVL